MRTNFIMSMSSGDFEICPRFVREMKIPFLSVHHSKTAGNKNIFLTTTGYKRVLHVQFMPSTARNKPVWKVLPLVRSPLTPQPIKMLKLR